MALQELDKVLIVKFYAKVIKETKMTDNELVSLKIRLRAIEQYLKEKTIHWAFHTNLYRLHLEISSLKTT